MTMNKNQMKVMYRIAFEEYVNAGDLSKQIANAMYKEVIQNKAIAPYLASPYTSRE